MSAKLPIDLSVGQWWLYRDSKKWEWPQIPYGIKTLRSGLNSIEDSRISAIVVVDMQPSPYGDYEVKVEFMVADDMHCPYSLHDLVWFIDSNFTEEEGHFKPFWSPFGGLLYSNSAIGVNTQYGVKCIKCRNYYPHAKCVKDFECWSCRHGF